MTPKEVCSSPERQVCPKCVTHHLSASPHKLSPGMNSLLWMLSAARETHGFIRHCFIWEEQTLYRKRWGLKACERIQSKCRWNRCSEYAIATWQVRQLPKTRVILFLYNVPLSGSLSDQRRKVAQSHWLLQKGILELRTRKWNIRIV